MEVRNRLKLLLRDYSIEDILELGELEVIDALEYLVIYGALELEDIVEATDAQDT